ncbi:hypothetical protein D3C81_1770410 [compost metagenome]
MLMPCWNERRLVRIQQERLLTIGHLRHSTYYRPMLTAMVMHLQRKGRARLDNDTLDLEALAFFQGGVGAPWTMHGAVKQVCVVPFLLQLGDDLLHLLAMLSMCNEDCIRRVDDYQVLHAYQCCKAFRAVDVVVVGGV